MNVVCKVTNSPKEPWNVPIIQHERQCFKLSKNLPLYIHQIMHKACYTIFIELYIESVKIYTDLCLTVKLTLSFIASFLVA